VSREKILLRCGKIETRGRNLLQRFADGRTDGAYLGGRRCVGRVHSIVYNASAVTRGAGHMLSEKSQRTQNGTVFVDLDWPLNASRRLSASAELLVMVKSNHNTTPDVQDQDHSVQDQDQDWDRFFGFRPHRWAKALVIHPANLDSSPAVSSTSHCWRQEGYPAENDLVRHKSPTRHVRTTEPL